MTVQHHVITSWIAQWDTHFVEPAVFGTTDPAQIACLINGFCQKELGAAIADYLFTNQSAANSNQGGDRSGTRTTSTARLKSLAGKGPKCGKLGRTNKKGENKRMRGPKAAKLTLSERERDELEQLMRGHNTPQHLALRGRMILLASMDKSNAQIARDLHTCDDTVRLWRMRWIGSQATSLDDLSVKERLEEHPRSGRPPRITTEQTCQLVAIACTPPSDHPTSHWTPRELADEVMARGIIDQISPRHASRLLKRGLSTRI